MQPAKYTLILFFLVMIVFSSWAQKQNAIGLRLIDPTGVTFKHYTNQHKAFEVGVGTIPDGWLDVYYRESFYSRDKYDGMKMRGSKRDKTLYLFGRLVMQYEIPVVDLDGKIEWYWGVGAVLKTAKLEYKYSSDQQQYLYYYDKRTDIDLGTDFIGGIEYTFDKVPFTVYTELSLFLEIVDRTNIRALGGIGGRYRF